MTLIKHSPLDCQNSLGQSHKYYLLLIVTLAAICFFINLGIAPLKHEEPRRALMALEMLFRDNWIVPTAMGELYFRKPPLYNWVVIAGFKLFGDFSEYAARFFSILSFLGMGVLVFRMGRRYVSFNVGAYAGLLTWVMVDVLFYFSATAGEIDLFYSFLTLASIFSIFHFYQRQQYYWLFIVTYMLGALGTLTKGLPSPVFLAVSLSVFFVYQGKLRQLFSLAHFFGIITFGLIVGGYFWWYDQYHSFTLYFTGEDSLWSQSAERTMLENKLGTLVSHLFLFPLETLKNVAPASLLLLFAARRGFITSIRQHPFILFCSVMFVSNILVYWISPGTRSRYVYMLYPLLVIVLTYGYFSFQSVNLSHRMLWFRRVISAIIGLLIVACAALPIIPQLNEISHLILITLVAVATLTALLIFHLKLPSYAVLNSVLLVVILRFVFALVILHYRAQTGSEATDKADANRITEMTTGQPLAIYPDSRFSLTTVFYIEREREEVLGYDATQDPEKYYLADRKLLDDKKYDVFYTFAYHDQEFVLIKFRER